MTVKSQADLKSLKSYNKRVPRKERDMDQFSERNEIRQFPGRNEIRDFSGVAVMWGSSFYSSHDKRYTSCSLVSNLYV